MTRSSVCTSRGSNHSARVLTGEAAAGHRPALRVKCERLHFAGDLREADSVFHYFSATLHFMQNYKYLIVGGGMTADSAVHGIRSLDSEGSIGVISTESEAPYNRPPLTKALWKGDPLESIWRKPETRNVTSHLGRTVKSLDVQNKRATDDLGNQFAWEKLLLATGGSPRRFPFGGDHIVYYRTLADYRRLRALTEKGQRFAVIGGGFIGSEIAAALALNGKKVTMLFPGTTIGGSVFPAELGNFLNGYYRDKGVELRPGETVIDVIPKGNAFVVRSRGSNASAETELEVDGVVAGIGIEPNIELARAAGLKTDNGIVVNEQLATSHPDIFAAGDVARFPNPALGKSIRVEHEDHANTSGQHVGRVMAGRAEPYEHLPMFYSDLFDLGYEAVGELSSRLETVTDWEEPNRKGVIYYLSENRVRGVLLWNVWGQVDAARQLIAQREPVDRSRLKGLIKG